MSFWPTSPTKRLPVDCPAQRLLARGSVARTADKQLQAFLEATDQRLRRQHPDAGRSQLDGERQPVQALADFHDGGSILVRQLELSPHSPCAFDEWGDRLAVRQRGDC
jgi:hypothetical protein